MSDTKKGQFKNLGEEAGTDPCVDDRHGEDRPASERAMVNDTQF
jgi:hypothetical protein